MFHAFFWKKNKQTKKQKKQKKTKPCCKVIVSRGMKIEVDRKIYKSPKIFHVNINTILCLRFKAFKLFVLN